MKRLNLSFLLATWVTVALAACSCPAPTPIPTEMPTEPPTERPTVLPTQTSMATFTKISTATPTEIPVFTRTPRPTPWLTWTPSPTPTPTPVPSTIGPFRLTPQAEGRPQGKIRDLRAAPDGTLWLVTEEGVGSLHGGTWTLHFSGRSGILAGFDDAGHPWLILDEGEAIAAWDGISWTVYGLGAGWFPVSFYKRVWWWFYDEYDLITDRRGWVWLVTDDDVRAFDGRTWTIYTPEEIGLAPHPDFGYSMIGLTNVALDGSGNIWVGGCHWHPAGGPTVEEPGARWFNGQTWEGADSHVVGSGCVGDIEVDAAGNVWVGMQQAYDRVDLWRYTPGEGWTPFTLSVDDFLYDSGARSQIDYIGRGPSGTLWIVASFCIGGGGECMGGSILFRFRVTDGTWEQLSEIGEYPEYGRVHLLAIGTNGTAFLYDSEGSIYRVAEGAPKLLVEWDGDQPDRVWVDPAGRVWVAIDDWLWVYEWAEGE